VTTKRARRKLWRHVGGGCWIAGKSPGPCDDEYRHEKTGARMTLRTTIDRHFDMPARVSGPAELRRLAGTSRIRESKRDKPTRASLTKRERAKTSGSPRSR
jgi:hypothetical protein